MTTFRVRVASEVVRSSPWFVCVMSIGKGDDPQ